MQVGKTKDQGLYNKPSAAVHPGALAAETLPQYNRVSRNVSGFVTDVSGPIFKGQDIEDEFLDLVPKRL